MGYTFHRFWNAAQFNLYTNFEASAGRPVNLRVNNAFIPCKYLPTTVYVFEDPIVTTYTVL
jgi:hypothetical protein